MTMWTTFSRIVSPGPAHSSSCRAISTSLRETGDDAGWAKICSLAESAWDPSLRHGPMDTPLKEDTARSLLSEVLKYRKYDLFSRVVGWLGVRMDFLFPFVRWAVRILSCDFDSLKQRYDYGPAGSHVE